MAPAATVRGDGMKGAILGFDASAGFGHIRGEDDRRYRFEQGDLRADRPVRGGEAVDFEVEDGAARDVYVLGAAPPTPAARPPAAARPAGAAVPPGDADAALVAWRQSAGGAATLKVFAIIADVIAVLGWLILVHKIDQTSSFAIQFDDHVQEVLGEWIASMLLITVIAAALTIAYLAVRGNRQRKKMAIAAALRTRIANGDGDRALLESQLRELGH